jgi:hypothetical protein
MPYHVIIDEERFENDDPVVTGRQLLNLAGRSPVEEHLIYWLTPDRVLEDLHLEETVTKACNVWIRMSSNGSSPKSTTVANDMSVAAGVPTLRS